MKESRYLALLLPLLCFSCNAGNQTEGETEQTRIQAIKLLSQQEEKENVRIIPYQVTPSSASQKIDLDLRFENGEDPSPYLEAKADEEKGTITLTCLQDFSKTATLLISSHFASEVKATITIDYTKKIKSIEKAQSTVWYTSLTSSTTFPAGEVEQKARGFYSPVYSSYSKVATPGGEAQYKVTSDIIVAYKNGKTSPYGEIDQSSTTLRDCPVGAPLLSLFDNMYSSYSKEEKKAVNAFQMWGVMRYYYVEISYNGQSFKQLMIHVIRFYVNSLPSYDPAL